MKCTNLLKAIRCSAARRVWASEMWRCSPALRNAKQNPSAPPKKNESASTSSSSSASTKKNTNSADNAGLDDMVLTPWSVESKGPKGIDYNRVREAFKAQSVSSAVRERLAALPGAPPLHPFFSRGIVFAHRDFDKALHTIEQYRAKKQQEEAEGGDKSRGCAAPPPAYLYTGRGPSAFSMHVGHAVPFLLTRYLQEALDLPAVIQITDDEKFLFRDVPFFGEEANKRVRSNIKDIIAFGFDPRRTFIFRNTHYMGQLYPTALAVQRAMTANAVRHTLGLKDTDCVGKFSFAATQAAPCFATAFPNVLSPPPRRGNLPTSGSGRPLEKGQQKEEEGNAYTPPQCIIPCAVDQDPFFVLARHAASRIAVEIGYHQSPCAAAAATAGADAPTNSSKPKKSKVVSCPPPATVYTTLLPALKGPGFKMSSSGLDKGILSLLDPAEVIERKLRKAFSGGAATLAEMTSQAGGVDLDADVAFQYLRFFCQDDDFLQDVAHKYTKGTLNSGDVKKICAETLEREFMLVWREKRAAVTEADVDLFCSVRSIC